MKTFLSVFIIFALFVMSGINTTMAFFVVSEGGIKMEMSMQMGMKTSDCTNDSHECCVSPFQKPSIISGFNSYSQDNKKIKQKFIHFDLLALLQEKYAINYNEKLNSPPETSFSGGDNVYIPLIGIVKSNC